MKKLYYLIVIVLISGLVLTGCLSNISQVPATEQSGITYLTKDVLTPDGLVGLWPFDEGTGSTAYDSSGNGNTGTLVNGPLWMAGKFGNALSFDGLDDYVDCGTNVVITTAITIEAWIKPDTFGDYEAIIANFKWPTNPEGYSFRVMANGKLVWRAVLSGNNAYSITSNSTMSAGNWYHVVLTHNGSYTRLYINGSLDKVGTPGGTIVNLGKALKIGWDDYAAGRKFNGIIDEVRIWNIVLSGPEIAQSYALGTDTSGAVIELNYKNLLGGGIAIFTSAFYVGILDLGEGVDVSARAMIVGSEAVVNNCALRGMTPKGADIQYTVSSLLPTGFDITASRENNKAKSLHLSMLLDTDEGLGVNVQFLPYD